MQAWTGSGLITVGRHTAAAGADVDPVVASALARRGGLDGGPRHADGSAAEDAGEVLGAAASEAADGDRRDGERRSSPVGWPGRDDDAPGGSPVGWPGPVDGEPAGEPTQEPAPQRARGWRRLFGSRAA